MSGPEVKTLVMMPKSHIEGRRLDSQLWFLAPDQSAWVPNTYMGNLDPVPGSWIQSWLKPGHYNCFESITLGKRVFSLSTAPHFSPLK